MSVIDDKQILAIINDTLGLNKAQPKKLQEAYVLQPKHYDVQTDILSQKSVSANVEELKLIIKSANQISAKLDSVDRSNVNSYDSEFRSLKMAEAYNLNNAFLMALHFDNIADPSSRIMMDSLVYIRLSRDFGTFENWQKDFIACALASRNGYALTVYNGSLNRYMNIVMDENCLGLLSNCYPVICLCMKEKMFFKDYLNDKKMYVFSMMKEFRWSLIDDRFKKADKLAKIFAS